MAVDQLNDLAARKRWADLEQAWLEAVEENHVEPSELLPVIDNVVKAGQGDLAATMGWAWLSTIKSKRSPRDALQLGRGLLLRLPDGDQLREEILALYVQTHTDRDDLPRWVERSGLKSGKSVRRALRFLDNGLRLEPGACLFHRTEDEAAQVESVDPDSDEVVLRTGRRTRTLSLDQVIEDYDVVDPHDFRVLRQLDPDRLSKLIMEDPAAVLIGILKGQASHQMDRDNLKLMLVPAYLSAGQWSEWWTKVRSEAKKSTNLRIEGRSPMMVVFDPVGQTLEQETWAGFQAAQTPRAWLDLLEGYLTELRRRKAKADVNLLNRVQVELVQHIQRFEKHREPGDAFATALVIERLAADGLPIETDVHGTALQMLSGQRDPVRLMASLPDQRLWSMGLACVEQVFPDDWPEKFARLCLDAPSASLIDDLVKAIEKAGRDELLGPVVEEGLSDPGRHTVLVMWAWKKPKVKATLPVPGDIELFNLIISLVGPLRESEGKVAGQTENEMRAIVRSGLSARNYERFRELLDTLDYGMAAAVRRQIERADSLGPTVRDEMLNIIREKFPPTEAPKKMALWEDESVLYFTEMGLRTKESEIDELVNVKMRENAKAIGEAASHGDLSENSEYKFALEERDLLRARLAQLNAEISKARVLDPAQLPKDHIGIGHRVLLRPVKGGTSVEYSVLGAGESDVAKRQFSYKTPLAMRMLGKRVGESISLTLDDGENEFIVERIEGAL